MIPLLRRLLIPNLFRERSPRPSRRALRPAFDLLEERIVPVIPAAVIGLPEPIAAYSVSDPTVIGRGTVDVGGAVASTAGVRYFDGIAQVVGYDLGSNAFGMPWGQTRSWSNSDDPGSEYVSAYASGHVNGFGWVDVQLPTLVGDEETVVLVENGQAVRYFTEDDGDYLSSYADQSVLTHDDGEGKFVLFDGAGGYTTFFDFSSAKPGQFDTYQAGGVTATVDGYSTYGHPEKVVITDGGVNEICYDYTYTVGSGTELLTNVKLMHGENVVRQVDYVYYADGEDEADDGNEGDLKYAIVRDGEGLDIDRSYYRYYVTTGDGAYQHGLKSVFSSDAYARLDSLPGSIDSISDGSALPFADATYEYDSTFRVTAATVRGVGGFTYEYVSNVNTGYVPGMSTWDRKTTETLSDGSQNVVYTNAYGLTLLEVFVDTANQQWMTFYTYDGAGRTLMIASPSAVDGAYELYVYEAYNDLMDEDAGNYGYVHDTLGLVTLFSYYDATSTNVLEVAGGVEGYQDAIDIARGEFGTTIPQSETKYFGVTDDTQTVYYVAESTVFRDEYGADPITTEYEYVPFPDSFQINSMETKTQIGMIEMVPVYVTTDVVYGSTGQPIWTRDADGYLTYTEYDPLTGAVVKTIQDVDDTNTTSFANLPVGWETPLYAGLHLVTQYEVDSLGRATKTTDANDDVTYVVYNDVAHETRTYAGWNGSTFQPTGPISIVRNVRDEYGGGFYGYFETLTISVTLSEGDLTEGNEPDGSEPFDEDNIKSLSRTYFNDAGQVVASDVYFSLTDMTNPSLPVLIPYSQAVSIGSSGIHYLRTTTSYDNRGRVNRTAAPDGAKRRTIFDSLGRVVSEWVGGNDAPSSGVWSPANPAGMVKVREYAYELNGVGDLSSTATAHPGNGAPDLVTNSFYDWRNRLVVTQAGLGVAGDINRPLTYSVYDNLGNVVTSEVYDGDTEVYDGDTDFSVESITYSAGVPNKPSSSQRRAQSDMTFDNLGRLSQTTQVGINQTTGATEGGTLTTYTFYDNRGNVTSTMNPELESSYFSFDGAGRLVATWDPLSRMRTKTYDGVGRLLTESAPGDQLTTYVYDAIGRLETTTVAISSGIDAVTTRSYDSAGRLKSILDAEGRTTEYTYDLAGRLLTTKDALSKVFGNVYGESGHLAFTYEPYVARTVSETVSMTGDTTWAITSYGYDERGRKSLTIDPLGRSKSVQYDDLDRVVVNSGPLGTGEMIAYDAVGRVWYVAQPENYVVYAVGPPQLRMYYPTFTTYNALGQVESTIVSADTNSDHDIVTTNRYDPFGRLAEIEDATEAVTKFGYDGANRRTSLTDPTGNNVTTFEYFADGQLKKQTDPMGEVTEHHYDAAGRLDWTLDRNGRKRTFGYDRANRKTSETWYSDNGTTEVDALSFTYDKVNNQLTATNNAGTQRMTYDQLNRVITTTQPSSVILTFGYDEVGNRVKVTTSEDNGIGDEYSLYDPAHQLVRRQQTVVTGASTTAQSWVDFFYDAAGREIATLRHQAASATDPTTDPRVVGVVVNGGPGVAQDVFGNTPYLPGQNSVVTQLLVTFNRPVTLDLNAFWIESLAEDADFSQYNPTYLEASEDDVAVTAVGVPGTEGALGVGGYTQFVLTFVPGAGVNSFDNSDDSGLGNQFTALKDGLWRLHTVGSKVHVGVSMTGADRSDVFWSLFGGRIGSTTGGATGVWVDGVGQTAIDLAFGSFANADPTYNVVFDGDVDGDNDGIDVTHFIVYFGAVWSFDDSLHDATTLVAFTSKRYDANNRLVDSISGNARSHLLLETELTYDFANRVVTKTVDGKETVYEYDRASQLLEESITGPGGAATEYDYDLAGNRDMDGYTLVDETVGLQEHVSANRYSEAGGWEFEYDNNEYDHTESGEGNVTGKRNVSTTPANGIVWAYAYDNRNHLTMAERKSDGVHVDYRITYKYDAWGNRIEESEDADGDGYSWDVERQYANAVNAASSEHATLVAAKALGAPNPTWEEVWDEEEEDYVMVLVNVWRPAATGTQTLELDFAAAGLADEVAVFEDGTSRVTKVELYYDSAWHEVWPANGSTSAQTIDGYAATVFSFVRTPSATSRVKLTVTSTGGKAKINAVELRTRVMNEVTDAAPATTQFVIDGWNPARRTPIGNENFDVRMDRSYVSSTSSLTTTYLHGDGVDQLISRNEVVGADIGNYVYLTDNQASVRAVVNAAGVVVAKTDYDAFGNIIAETNKEMLGRYGYASYILNRTTNLLGPHGRPTYDPRIGRFYNVDPKEADVNPYRYVHNGPTNATDPSGFTDDWAIQEVARLQTDPWYATAYRFGNIFGLAALAVRPFVRTSLSNAIENSNPAARLAASVEHATTSPEAAYEFVRRINPWTSSSAIADDMWNDAFAAYQAGQSLWVAGGSGVMANIPVIPIRSTVHGLTGRVYGGARHGELLTQEEIDQNSCNALVDWGMLAASARVGATASRPRMTFSGNGQLAVAGAPAVSISASWSPGALSLFAMSMTREEAIEAGLTPRDPQWPWRGLHESEGHHPLMQGSTHRRFWRARGLSDVDVEGWVVELDADIHRGITESGWWDDAVFRRIAREESRMGRLLTRQETIGAVSEILDEVFSWTR